jgi:hypothetical protein
MRVPDRASVSARRTIGAPVQDWAEGAEHACIPAVQRRRRGSKEGAERKRMASQEGEYGDESAGNRGRV